MNYKNIPVYFSIALMLLLLTAATSSAATYTVNNSTGMEADFTSIQAAVNASSMGDII